MTQNNEADINIFSTIMIKINTQEIKIPLLRFGHELSQSTLK